MERREALEDFIDRSGIDEEVHVFLRCEALVTALLHHSDEFVEVVVDVEEGNWLLVNVDLTP